MIIFHENTTLYVVREYDEANDEIVDGHEVEFINGVPYDAEIGSRSGNGDYVDLQFADGTMVFAVWRASFDVVGTVGNPLAYKPKLDKLPLP